MYKKKTTKRKLISWQTFI